MNRIRMIAGIASLVLIAVGLNILLLQEAIFVAAVYIPLALGALFAGVWLVLRIVSAFRESGGGAPYGLNAAIGAFAFLGICILLYAFAKRSDASWDLTREGRTELAPQTVQVLQGLDQNVEVTCFFVPSGGGEASVAQDKTERFLLRCAKYSAHLLVEFSDPQREPERLKELKVLRVSEVGTIVLRSGTRTRVIPLSDVTSRLEERDFTNALINVASESSPHVYFLIGHGERDILDTDPKTGGSDLRLWLEKESYQVARHTVPLIDPKIPEDASAVVINGYEASFREHDIEALDAYIERGGRILLLVNPQFIENRADNPIERMRPWLDSRFGVRVGSNLIVSMATKSYQIMFVPDFSILGQLAGRLEPTQEFRGSFNATHPITRTMDKQLVFTFVRTVELDDEAPDGTAGRVLLRTTPDTWAETDIESVIAQKAIQPDLGETQGPNSVGVAVSLRTAAREADPRKGKDARIVVLGDADLASNESIAHVGNHTLLLNSIAWLTEREDLIAIRPTGEEDPPIIMSGAEQRLVAWIAALGPVQVIALAALATYLMRRRNQ